MIRSAVAVAAVVVLCAAGSLRADTKEDMKMLDGTWVPVSGELAGEKFPDETLKTIKLEVKDGKYTVTVGKEGTDKGIVTLDATKKPKEMDLVGTDGPNKGKKILAIYELTDDTLKVCYALDGKDRPKEFVTKQGTMGFMLTYKRQKP
jgi:uncharacterized protein (TIGR03067 family)